MRLIDADALKQADFQDFSNTDVLCAIDEAPTINAVPVVRAEWKKDSDYPWLLNCSVCGYSTERGTNYCPNCGAEDGRSA